MTELQLHKQTLLLESDMNRLSLYAECENLRDAAGWVSRIGEIRRAAGPWTMILAPVAGAALAMCLRRKSSGEKSFLYRAVEVLPALLQAWRAFNPPADGTK